MVPAAGLRLALAVFIVASWSGCEDGSSTEGPTTSTTSLSGWQQVSFEGVDFDVPLDWPVTRSEDWYEFRCTGLDDEGVFLAPSGPPESTFCPLTRDYGITLHVVPFENEVTDPGEVEVEGSGDSLRWTRSTPANHWHDVVFPERGIRLVFYEVDDTTYERIVSSVTGSRA